VIDLRGNTGGQADDLVDLGQALTHSDAVEMTVISMTRIGEHAIRTTSGTQRRPESERNEAYRNAQAAL